MTGRRICAACALLAFAIGFGLWASAPLLVGRREPWDAELPFYYTGLMLLGGGAVGAAFPGRVGCAFLGFWVGQAVAFLVLPGHDRGWAWLGLITTGLGSLFGVGGFLGGWLLRSAVSRPAGGAAGGVALDRSIARPAWTRFVRTALIRLFWLPLALRAAWAGSRLLNGWDAIAAEFVLLVASVGSSVVLGAAGCVLMSWMARRREFVPALAAATLLAGSVCVHAVMS